jgi:hypothetical protein
MLSASILAKKEIPMPYELSWYKPDHILYMKSPLNISEEDTRSADEAIHRYMTEAKTRQVHIIIDDTEVSSMPGILVTQTLKTLKHPKMGWTVVVGQNNKVYRMMYTITCHLQRLPLYLADTMDEAITFLEKTQERSG